MVQNEVLEIARRRRPKMIIKGRGKMKTLAVYIFQGKNRPYLGISFPMYFNKELKRMVRATTLWKNEAEELMLLLEIALTKMGK